MFCAMTGATARAQAPAGQGQAPAGQGQAAAGQGQAAAGQGQAAGGQGQAAAGQGQAAAGQPQWKDRAEFDLFESIRNEQDPTKKIALLNQWKEKYPGSEFKKVRAGLLVQTYQNAKDVPGLVG